MGGEFVMEVLEKAPRGVHGFVVTSEARARKQEPCSSH